MGLQSWFAGKLGLTSHDRQTIHRLFGSFNSIKIGSNQNTLLQKGYEQNVDVFSVIKKITDTFKSVPWIVEQRQADGTYIKIDNTSIHELMSAPNMTKGYTWEDIDEQMLIYLLASGNNYMIGNTQINKTLIEEVDILPAPYVCPISNGDFFNPAIRYEFELGTNDRTFQADEIEHTKIFNPGYSSVDESLLGLSLIQVAKDAVSVGNERWDAHANLLQNRGAVGMITDKSARPMLPEEAQNVQDAWNRDIQGAHNSGKIKVTNKDLSYIQMAMSATDLQLVNSDVVTLRAVCNVFGLDSSLFNDPANKTFNNRKEAEKALFTNAIIPIAEKVGQSHTQFIAKNHFPDGRVRDQRHL